MNLRGKGKEIDSDIRDLMTGKIDLIDFKKKYGSELCSIIDNIFMGRLLDILLMDNSEEKTSEANKISTSIAMFCAAFIE